MREMKGDLWTMQPVSEPLIVRVITTNGFVKADGRAVMGRGVAYQASKKLPTLPLVIGTHIKKNGNVVWGPAKISSVRAGRLESMTVMTFPVKHNWWEDADLLLIRQSASKLHEIASNKKELTFLLPKPGCGNGRLEWVTVKQWLKGLPDNVVVIDK